MKRGPRGLTSSASDSEVGGTGTRTAPGRPAEEEGAAWLGGRGEGERDPPDPPGPRLSTSVAGEGLSPRGVGALPSSLPSGEGSRARVQFPTKAGSSSMDPGMVRGNRKYPASMPGLEKSSSPKSKGGGDSSAGPRPIYWRSAGTRPCQSAGANTGRPMPGAVNNSNASSATKKKMRKRNCYSQRRRPGAVRTKPKVGRDARHERHSTGSEGEMKKATGPLSPRGRGPANRS